MFQEVYADYQECQKLMKSTPKTFSRTDIDALDDMLDEWEKEDAATVNTQQPVPAPHAPQEPQLTPPQGRIDDSNDTADNTDNTDKLVPAEATIDDGTPEATFAPEQ